MWQLSAQHISPCHFLGSPFWASNYTCSLEHKTCTPAANSYPLGTQVPSNPRISRPQELYSEFSYKPLRLLNASQASSGCFKEMQRASRSRRVLDWGRGDGHRCFSTSRRFMRKKSSVMVCSIPYWQQVLNSCSVFWNSLFCCLSCYLS